MQLKTVLQHWFSSSWNWAWVCIPKVLHSTTAHHTAADYFGIFMWVLVDKLVKGQKENLNETHYYLLLCQLTALLFIFHWMPSSLRRISTFRYILWKEYAAFASASTSFLNFTFCCTRSCFLAAQVYFIFSGHQSTVGLCSLENENTHPY